MRVLVLSEFYPHERNPHEGIFVREQLVRLARHCEIRVIAPAMRHVPLPRYKVLRSQEAPPGDFPKELPPVTRVPLWNLPKIAEQVAPAMYLRGAQSVLAEMGFIPDLIHAFWSYRSGYIGAKLKAAHNCPLIVTAAGSDIHTWLHQPRFHNRVLHALNSADAIIGVSRAIAEEVSAAGIAEPKIHHIPNGVDLASFTLNKGSLSSELRKRFCGVSLFLCVANLFSVKGQDVLIRALAFLPAEQGAVVFVGDGPERERLEKLVEELKLTARVLFAGKKPHQEIAEWMNAADALVIPSRKEGGPAVVYEALACGLQVVGTAVGIIPEAIDSDEVGLVVPPDDPAALASAMSKIAERKTPDREKLRARAEMFSWDRLSERVLQVYQSVAGVRAK